MLKLFESTEMPLHCRDYFISGNPAEPDPQEEIVYNYYQTLYPELGKQATQTVVELGVGDE